MSVVNSTVLVFFLLGQSNMEGWLSCSSELPSELHRVPENCFLYGMDDVKLSPGDDFRSQKHFGPEVSLMHRLGSAFPNTTLVFIKVARGGHSITAFLPGVTLPEVGPTKDDHKRVGTLWEALDALHARVIEDFPNREYKAMFWYQGERDARVPSLSESYKKNFLQASEKVRSLSGSATLPAFLVRVSPPEDIFVERKKIRKIQEHIASSDEQFFWVDSDDAPKVDDRVHHNSTGQILVGKRLAEAFLSTQ